MDSRRFDTLTRALGSLERRQVLALLPATVAAVLALPDDAAASKKGQRRRNERRRFNQRWQRRKRRNTFRCLSTGGQRVRCWKGSTCCDPDRSNVAGCSAPSHTTCCTAPDPNSKFYGYVPGYHCCPTPVLGFEGACPDDRPVCCSDNYCCPSGSDCSDLSGCARLVTEAAARFRSAPN